jgi:hypothetical protein
MVNKGDSLISVAGKPARAAPVAVVCAVGLLAGPGSALAETKTFTYTGKEQEFKVPAGVTSLEVVAIGSEGGTATGAAQGGVGAVVSGKLTVKPEQVLYVEVGRVPFNGGGRTEKAAQAAGRPTCARSRSAPNRVPAAKHPFYRGCWLLPVVPAAASRTTVKRPRLAQVAPAVPPKKKAPTGAAAVIPQAKAVAPGKRTKAAPAALATAP